jgi:serine/threonine protein kinase
MYCAGGSLWDAIRRVSQKGSWSWDSRLQVTAAPPCPALPLPSPCSCRSRAPQILADVAQGLMHMHELDPPLIHRDVKSPNILLTAALPDARARLADLGCTKVARDWSCAALERSASRVAFTGLPRWCTHDVCGHAAVDGA